MKFCVVTLFPAMVQQGSAFGVVGRALERGSIELSTIDPRAFAKDTHRTVDDRPYGGGPGMVLKVEPMRSAIRQAAASAPAGSRIVYLSAQGRPLDQGRAQQLSRLPGMVLVAGRYEGIDERLIESEIDEELSLGDFVMSGGELAALAVIDVVTRLLPGVLGHEQSAEQDSFMAGLLDYPHYTRPEIVDGMAVPEVLLRGNHGEIERWRMKQSLGRTWLRRPELLARLSLTEQQKELLKEFIAEHEAHTE